MKLRTVILIAALTSSAAVAQQAPVDPAYSQQVIGVLQNQRNQALAQAADANAAMQILAAENERLKVRVKELEAKDAPKPTAPPP